MSAINDLLRPNIRTMRPYSSARDDFKGNAHIWLDANENPNDRDGLNRYPDPYQRQLKARISEIRLVPAENVFLGNGSDEAIDLLIRVFCTPGKDKVITFVPTYGMYQVCADVNDVEVVSIPLNADFHIESDSFQVHLGDASVKIAFICSPNNPSGNLMSASTMEHFLQHFKGITVIDEAYIDFAHAPSWSERLNKYPRLVVLQTLSKAFGLAGIRLGIAFAAKEIIAVLNRIKPPYNVSELTQREALRHLETLGRKEQEVERILAERSRLATALQSLPVFTKVYPSDANFLLAITPRANELYRLLSGKGIVVRNRCSSIPGGLRITIGTPIENDQLLEILRKIKK